MRSSKVFATGVVGLTLAFGTGCHHAATAEAAPAQAAQSYAPPLAGAVDVASLVAKVKPAVVNITIEHDVKLSRNMESPFGFFMRPGPGPDRGGDEEDTIKQRALGSGFIVDAQGHVVTNAHVVDGADVVRVKLADDREFKAKVRGKDERLDLAVLELEGAKNLPFVPLGSSDAVRVGESVIAIGNPFGLGHTVTAGIVSAKGRTIGAGPYDDFLQTDASINPGNSGGPLFNTLGQVVGVNTAISREGRGIGFAIPVDAVKDVLPQLLKTGHVERGRLGVVIQGVDDPMAKALGMAKPHGALVGQVEANGPAAKAGIQTGDVITAVDGTDVPRSRDLPRIVARHPPGQKVEVKVLRSGAEKELAVTLDALKDDSSNAKSSPSSSPDATTPAGSLGIGIEDGPNGVVVTRLLPGSPAAGALQPGDEIVEVNREKVQNAADLSAKVRKTANGKPVLLLVRREGMTHWVAIERK
jgi:serine protease Do